MIHKTLFSRKFSAAHRLLDDQGPCGRIHGHNYRAIIRIAVERLNSNGMVVHADEVKNAVDNRFDHRLILFEVDPLILAREVPLTGFQEDEGRTRLAEYGDPGWIVRVGFQPTTENLAQYIADSMRYLVDRDQGHGWAEVDLDETETITAYARVEW